MRKPLSADVRANLRIAVDALAAARKRAIERGLTAEQVDQEENDNDSQFWEDVYELVDAARSKPEAN